jgi:hypothetical protein
MGGESIAAPFPEYADDPVGFMQDQLGVKRLTVEQLAMILGVQEDRVTNVRAAVALGKTFGAALLCLWWAYCVGGRFITTAPRASQVDLIWGEIKDLHERNKWRLGGICLTRSLKIGGRVRGKGFVASPYAKEGFGGRHDPFLLAVIDEASGVEQNAEDGITANVTEWTNRLLRIGNALSVGTPYWRACQKKSLKIPVWTHPNVAWAYTHSELKPAVAKRILNKQGEVLDRREWPEAYRKKAASIPGGPSVEWIEELRVDDLRGPGTAYWTARVDAEFPEDTERALVPRSWFELARNRYELDPEGWDKKAMRFPLVYGIDVGDGGDPHAIVAVRGPVLYSARNIATIGDDGDLVRIRKEATRLLGERPGNAPLPNRVHFDRTGVGSGPYEEMLQDEAGYNVYGYHFGGGATEDKKELFLNQRAQRYWMVRRGIETGKFAIARLDPREEEGLKEELAAIKYERMPNGKIKIELKDLTKKRLNGRSPNLGDAYALAQDLPMPEDADGFFEEEVTEGGFFV